MKNSVPLCPCRMMMSPGCFATRFMAATVDSRSASGSSEKR